ncbi:MAG: GNAT family N-acetyltransferase [Bacteroidota bacterium]
MTIRIAEPSDAPLIEELAIRIWWAHYPEIVSNEQIAYMLERGYSVPALQQQMAEGQVFRIIYSESGDAIGYISISCKSPGSYFIHKFYVDTQQQGKGIGVAVFQQVLNSYPDLQELRLVVNRRNYRSINFYFKVGFTIEFCLDTPIGEGFSMDDFQMLWKRPNTPLH